MPSGLLLPCCCCPLASSCPAAAASSPASKQSPPPLPALHCSVLQTVASTSSNLEDLEAWLSVFNFKLVHMREDLKAIEDTNNRLERTTQVGWAGRSIDGSVSIGLGKLALCRCPSSPPPPAARPPPSSCCCCSLLPPPAARPPPSSCCCCSLLPPSAARPPLPSCCPPSSLPSCCPPSPSSFLLRWSVCVFCALTARPPGQMCMIGGGS